MAEPEQRLADALRAHASGAAVARPRPVRMPAQRPGMRPGTALAIALLVGVALGVVLALVSLLAPGALIG